jgi:dGTPase
MINFITTDFIQTTLANIEAAQPQSIDDVRAQPGVLAALSATGGEEHMELKSFLNEHLYQHYKVLRMTSKARRVLKALFDAFFDEVSLMPPEHRDAALISEKERGPAGRARAVADYVAGMTDRYALIEHSRLFDANEKT